MNSALYEGWVHHRRHGAVEHAFRRRIALAYLDTDELPDVLALGPLASSTGPALVRLRREDLLGDPAVPVADAVRDLVAESSGVRPDGPVRILCALRSLGVGFNPVRFYYAWHEDRLHSVVAEVTNTPWGERHAYALDASGGEVTKQLHVSPFQPMQQRYRWSVPEPGEQLLVRLESHEEQGPALTATLRLSRRPLTRRSIARVLLTHPPQPLQTLSSIYGQAARLKAKGAPYHPHPRTAA